MTPGRAVFAAITLSLFVSAAPAYAEINSPVAISNVGMLPPRRLDVLLYFANETSVNEAGTRNYAVIVGWLRDAATPEALKIAGQLERDLRVFPAVVDSDLADFEAALPSSRIADRTTAVVLTNRLSREHACLVLYPGEKRLRRERFDAAPASNYILAGSPLSQVGSFERAIARTAELFPPATARYTLLVNRTARMGSRSRRGSLSCMK